MCSRFHLAFLDALGGSPLEMAVIVLAILLLFGANALPDTLRTLGRWSAKLQRLSRDLQRELTEAGSPIDDARRAWEAETRDLTVSSSSRTPPPADPSPAPTEPHDEA